MILRPTSSWQVDYGDEKCRLARQFGEGKETVLLLMDRFGPTEYFKLTIAGKLMKAPLEKGEANVQFGPNEPEQMLEFLNGNLGDEPALVFSSSARIAPPNTVETLAIKDRKKTEWVVLQPISEDRKKAVRNLRVGKPLRKPVTLETGSMRGP